MTIRFFVEFACNMMTVIFLILKKRLGGGAVRKNRRKLRPFKYDGHHIKVPDVPCQLHRSLRQVRPVGWSRTIP